MRRKLLTAFTAALIIIPAAVFALGGGTSNADFLKIGVGARSSGMGEAYAAVADDANAAFWNPAGIAQADKWSFTLMHLIWFAGSNYEFFGGIAPIDSTTAAGLSVNYFWIPPFNSTKDSFGAILAQDAEMSYDLAITGTFAKILGNFYTKDFTIGNVTVGANITYIQRQLLGEALPGIVAADLGILANITEPLKMAFVISDIGTSTGKDQTPLNLRLGAAYDIPFSKEFGLLLSSDATKPIDITNPEYAKFFVNLGLEMRIADMVYLRGGYKFGRGDESFTAGAGFGIKDLGNIDYAFIPHTELGATHRISLSFMLGNPVERPVIGGPRPPQKVNAMSGDKMVSIGWDPNQESNITGYNIYYRRKGTYKYEMLNKKPVMEEAKFRAVLENDTDYEFGVTAMNNRGLESVMSEIVVATPKKYTAVKPEKMESVFTKQSDAGIVVMWNAPDDERISGFNLYYKKKGDEKYKKLNRQIIKETKATLAGLQANMEYTFVVTAISKDGIEGEFSDPISARIEE
ncbi:MAG: hypothetical protein CVV21_12425 [Candidatus Goldiibacteriota bacterium HGW-Goldbacteria-1]|jgi:hypothetical protein|nr:MAG: hypothetical protein CVV21_12425 [Candidatus Goldiibacteriota bacterium HGW-Goldbacteria-1]